MRPYSELNALAPEAFLNWESFKTGTADDGTTVYSVDQYEKGLRVGQQSTYVFISANGTWGARGKDGSQTTSYEGIGYHSGTAMLLKGFLDSGVPIKVYRSGPSETWIKGSQQEANARAECSLARD